jgi:hypothetical protein
MLIDTWMPEYDFVERHETPVRAPASTVHRSLMEVDFGGHPVVRVLLGLRTLPGRLLRRPAWDRPTRLLRLREAPGFGFVLLEERPPHEVVLGLTGRFWRVSGGLVPTDPSTFRDCVPAGSARVAWSFELCPRGEDATLLSTETRIRCADAAARRAFGRYWLLVRPGSGLIRRALLRSVKVDAERSARVARSR